MPGALDFAATILQRILPATQGIGMREEYDRRPYERALASYQEFLSAQRAPGTVMNQDPSFLAELARRFGQVPEQGGTHGAVLRAMGLTEDAMYSGGGVGQIEPQPMLDVLGATPSPLEGVRAPKPTPMPTPAEGKAFDKYVTDSMNEHFMRVGLQPTKEFKELHEGLEFVNLWKWMPPDTPENPPWGEAAWFQPPDRYAMGPWVAERKEGAGQWGEGPGGILFHELAHAIEGLYGGKMSLDVLDLTLGWYVKQHDSRAADLAGLMANDRAHAWTHVLEQMVLGGEWKLFPEKVQKILSPWFKIDPKGRMAL